MTRTQRRAPESQRTQTSSETSRAVGSSGRLMLAALVSCALALLASLVSLAAVDSNDWPSHDHDAGGQRFSPLKQITPANVATLQPAWTFDTGAPGLQVTPLVINGIMYVTAGNDVIAL